MSKLSLHVKDFRAIDNAGIELDGITVISGINSSGKSTLSRLLYYAVKLTLELEEILTNNLIHELGSILTSLSTLLNEYQIKNNFQPSNKENIRTLWYRRARTAEIESLDTIFNSMLQDIEKSFLSREEQRPFSDNDLNRISFALNRHSTENSLPLNGSKNISDLFNNIRVIANNTFTEALDNIQQRPLKEFEIRLHGHLQAYKIPFSLFEDKVSIINRDSGRLNNLFSIENVFYSDTPMAVSHYNSEQREPNLSGNKHWNYLQRTILDSFTVILNEKQKQVSNEIEKIINGNVSVEQSEFEQGFSYKRSSDGLTIDLVESATGIKSFAILQLLLSRGLLNEKTLLILDEPEAHLHPQWIVEYARILVLLNKELGVKFMIASHNPDMVSALRYISEKEEILGNMHFYLAEKIEGTEQFNYRNLENDIEPIFSSFNIALERINQYGV